MGYPSSSSNLHEFQSGWSLWGLSQAPAPKHCGLWFGSDHGLDAFINSCRGTPVKQPHNPLSLPLHDHKPHALKMVGGFNPTTPQQKAVKDLLDAYETRDINNVKPLVSKNFKFQTFPKIAHHPDEENEAHFDRYGKLLSAWTKLVVRLGRREIAFNIAG